MFKKLFFIAAAASMFVGCSNSTQAPSASAASEIEQGFNNPPKEAMPRVWWHWMNGNITKDGALKDLEWMNRIGIAGFQTFDAALTTPQIVDHRIIYMTDEWKDVFKTITEKANSYGMEMAIAGSPGWSESGGPWVEKKEAMKKVVWSEVDIKGGAEIKVALPNPPSAAGLFQNFGVTAGASSGVEVKSDNEYYEDIAVIAMKMPQGYKSLSELNPTVTANAGKVSLGLISDEDYVTSTFIPFDAKTNTAWIQYEFKEPATIFGASIVGSAKAKSAMPIGGEEQQGVIEISNDGKTFTQLVEVPTDASGVSAVAFPAATAKYFRLVYEKSNKPAAIPLWAAGLADLFGTGGPEAKGATVAEFNLFTAPRVHRFVEKAAFANAATLDGSAIDQTAGIPQSDIINISDKMASDGTLTWTPGEGTWKVIRFGFSLTGHQNSPASPEATGLEVDKMNAEYVTKYFENYLKMYEDATGGLMGAKGLQYIITDSWEAGPQNWTDKMIEEFKADAGYDMTSWLPTLAGYAVENTDSSDKFLWDYRKTIADLNAKNHYDLLTDLLAKKGMARYSESHENSRALTADGMQVKKTAAVPMSAMWTDGLGQSGADIRESSSTAHIYGQKFIAAESLTTGSNAWGHSPASLKPTADWEMANGLNRFVIHESAHQPLDDYKPGLTLGPFGQWFSRHETWAEQAKVWISYLGKSSYLLSRGNSVADILYYYGENTNITAQYNTQLPDIPEGYDFDFVNPDAVMNDLTVKSGKIVAPSGAQYSMLYIGEGANEMSVPVLKAIDKLVSAGAKVVGARPTVDPSLADDASEWQSLCDKLWGGKIIETDLEHGVAQLGINPDVTYTRPNENTELKFKHRVYNGVQIYWVLTRTTNTEDVEVSFNVQGLKPEIWNAMTGKIEQASYTCEGGITTVNMHFDPQDALFVIFRSKTSEKAYTVPAKTISTSAVDGTWQVAFNGMGCPESVEMELSDLKDNANPFIKYYAGDIIYTKTINLTAEQLDGQTSINLGDVAVLAEVKVNGVDCGIAWKTPYKLDISSAVKEGENEIEVKVVNLWVNRMIGDERGGAGKFTHTTQVFHRATEALIPSGLIGPVAIETAK